MARRKPHLGDGYIEAEDDSRRTSLDQAIYVDPATGQVVGTSTGEGRPWEHAAAGQGCASR